MSEIQFVLDCSVAMLWAYDDETNPSGAKYAKQVLKKFQETAALVPNIWPLEVSNVLLVLERRNIMDFHECQRFIKSLRKLPLKLDSLTNFFPEKTYELAREYEISSYDAAYLELAMRHQIPLATNDKKLKQVAQKTVGVF